jgi:hypothetical protein
MAENPIRIEGLLCKIESVYGTDPTPTAAANGIRISERLWAQISFEYAFSNLRDEVVTGTLLPLGAGPKRGWIATLDFGVELTGFGAAYSATDLPSVHPLIRSSGCSQTVVTTGGAETVTYTLEDTGHESCTIWAYGAGNIYKIVGCRGELTWPFTPGELGLMRFRVQGLVASVATGALPAITYTAEVPPPMVGLALTVGGWTPTRVSGEFTTGATIVRRDSAQAADGVTAFSISRFDPHFRLTAETDALATANPYDDAKPAAGGVPTNRTIDLTLGSAQYQRAKLDVDNATVESISHQDLDGFAGWEILYRVTAASIVFD